MAEYNNVIHYLGEAVVPQNIRRRRRQAMEVLRRMGTPVLIKHMYNIDDVAKGVATESPHFDTIYKQSEQDDPFSHGVGYVSIETQPGEWIDIEGNLRKQANGEPGWIPAPKYKGYGPGYLTYIILPDAPEDVFKRTPSGALLHTQLSTVQLPWWPFCGDNDLVITVELDVQENVIDTFARYQLKKVTPISMRGLDRSGQREFGIPNAAGNRHWISQTAEANKVLETDPIYTVETDR
jgi:hypothetical protein